MPLLAWAKPLYERHQLRVLTALQAMALRHPDLLDEARLRDSIDAAFARPVLAACQRTLILELGIARHLNRLQTQTPQSRFQEFLDWLCSPPGRRYMRKHYPLLCKDVALRAQQVSRFVLQMLRNIAKDSGKLAQWCMREHGPLLQFQTEMGDRHANGCSVVKLQFAHICLYYKPRSMAVDAAFSRLLAWLAADGVEPIQRGPSVLDRHRYGYAVAVPFDSASSEDELQSYYRRFGGLAAISYVLGSTDLHDENVIAAGAWPVVIDAETLFQPQAQARYGARTCPPVFAGTVLYSGLMPTGSFDSEHQDTSALFMPQESYYARVPSDPGTDMMRLTVQRQAMPFARNMARLNGQVAPAHRYVQQICAGFEHTYRALWDRKSLLLSADGPLAPFRPLTVRVVLRPTQIYAHLLTMLSHPDYLQSPQQRTALLEHLRVPARGGLAVAGSWAAEHQALLCGDVPYFSMAVDGLVVHDDQGQPTAAQYARSGWQESRSVLKKLSLRDLHRQRRLVQQSVACTRPIDFAGTWSPASAGTVHPAHGAAVDWVQEATGIAEHLLATACDDHGHTAYYQLEFRGHPVLRPYALNADLYNGLPGLAIFFGELARTTGNTRYRRASERVLASVRRELMQRGTQPSSIGAFCGLGGWIYTLALLGARLEQTQWTQEALDWLPALAAGVADDRYLDVTGGSAGALLVLLSLEALVPGKGAMQVARACANRLQATAQVDSRGACWVGKEAPDQRAMTGFSHGTSGIAAALSRFADASGEAQYLDLARSAMRFERASLDVPPASRHGGHSMAGAMHAWCHGAPGTGLGLLMQPESMRDAQWRHDLDHCLTATLGSGFSGSHCICHGQLGNLELLMQAASMHGADPRVGHWHAIAKKVLHEGRSEWRTGSIPGYESLGFMTGLAGIGYALLRINDTHHVPSVASLQLQAPNNDGSQTWH